MKALLRIHLSIMLFGLVGLFAAWLPISPMAIVAARVVFATLALSIVIYWRKEPLSLVSKKHYTYFILLGALLALHWVTLFTAIQYATVAIGLLAFSTFPIFTALLAPLLEKTTFQFKQLVYALIVLWGLTWVLPNWSWHTSNTRAVLFGVVSGASFALLSILNRKWGTTYSPLVIAWYQDSSAALLLLPWLFNEYTNISLNEWGALVFLGVVCTALAHVWFIQGLKNVPVQTASLIACLEPIYGILAAILFLNEWPTWQACIGGGIILGVTTYATWEKVQQNYKTIPTNKQ